MSTAKTKKLIRRRQKGPLQRSSARGIVTGGRAANRTRSATDSALSSPGLSPSLGSRRESTLGALTRSQSTRSLTPGRPEARRARADARADTNLYSPPQVSKPAPLNRQNARRDLNPTKAKQISPKGETQAGLRDGAHAVSGRG